MVWLLSFLKGFFYAGRGVAAAVRQERNLRIHLTVAFYVTAAALLAELDRLKLAILCLCFGLVLGMELLNTAVERACDAIDTKPNPLIQVAKDAAAGGVLLAAISTVLVGILLFASHNVWQTLWGNLISFPFFGVLLLLLFPLFLFWIIHTAPTSRPNASSPPSEQE